MAEIRRRQVARDQEAARELARLIEEARGAEAIGRFVADVRDRSFPNDDESYHIADAEADALGLYGKA